MKRWLIVAALLWPAAWLSASELPARGTVQVFFTPWDDAEGALIRTIESARASIEVQAYIFTSRSLARALTEAHRRGVRVRVLADDAMARDNPRAQIGALAAAGIEVRLETRYAAAHNKVMLIDAESKHAAVVTGSYNFTFSAQARNAENVLILRDNPELVRAYLDNWRRHHDEATSYAASSGRKSAPAQR